MSSTAWETFFHPHKAYRLQFPAHWEHRVEQDGKSCGFGPRDRDNVGLWISIMPYMLDTEQLVKELPVMFAEALKRSPATNLRKDNSLRHHGMKADTVEPGQGGHYWLIVGGDLVLFASSQVPTDEREIWNPEFDRLMASLQITRDDELMMIQAANEVLDRLQELRPDQDYQWDEDQIRGRNHIINLENLYRHLRENTPGRDKIIKTFVEGFASSPDSLMVDAPWEEAQRKVLPVLKPKSYIKNEGPTRHVFTTEWLDDVVICYALRAEKTFRFVTGWDCGRWGINGETLHARSIQNLTALDWPKRLEGSRQPSGGRLILVDTRDSFTASRLLHPDLHRIFSGPLGSPFLAGIPDRETLVAFTNSSSIKRKIARQVRKDYEKSAYPITPRLFLVTADGIALAPKE